jgi:hypothetical protein
MTVEKKKKHINELTEEFRPFWEPLFKDMGVDNPLFFAKLCYSGNEFLDLQGPTPVFRVFAEQISKGQDVYIEMYDWDDNPYHTGYRTLYVFKNNPEWRDDKSSYVEITKKSDGSLLAYPSYTFRLSHLELVNKSPLKVSFAEKEVENLKIEDAENLEFFDDNLDTDSYEDAHYTNMTIRDIYCIFHNTPKSNKKWLNELIKHRYGK